MLKLFLCKIFLCKIFVANEHFNSHSNIVFPVFFTSKNFRPINVRIKKNLPFLADRKNVMKEKYMKCLFGVLKILCAFNFMVLGKYNNKKALNYGSCVINLYPNQMCLNENIT